MRLLFLTVAEGDGAAVLFIDALLVLLLIVAAEVCCCCYCVLLYAVTDSC